MAADDSDVQDQLKSVNERLASIDHTLVKMDANWAHHVYRTDLAEKNIELLRESTEKALAALNEDVEPLKTRNAMFDGALKLFGLVAALVGIGAGIAKIIQVFFM